VIVRDCPVSSTCGNRLFLIFVLRPFTQEKQTPTYNHNSKPECSNGEPEITREQDWKTVSNRSFKNCRLKFGLQIRFKIANYQA
jgi:hypothetical protein